MARAALICSGILAIYVLRLNGAAGLMVDDAWYIMLAKALAGGDGYRLINSPATPILPLYPPGFPAILSLAFHLAPDFPQNVWLLKGVSVAAMCGVFLLTFLYVHRHRNLPRDLSLCTAAAVAISPAFVFLATSTVMSECVFTLAQLAAIVMIHRSEAPSSPRRRLWVIGAGIVAAAMVLIRSAGVGLVVAAALWFVSQRRVKTATLFVAVVAACLVPWTLYSRSNAPTPEERAMHGGAVSYDYLDQIGMRWAGSPAFGRITLADVPARLGNNLLDIFGRDVGGIVAPVLFRGPGESGEEVVSLGGKMGLLSGSMGGAPETMVISFLLTGVALVGYVRSVRERVTVAEMLVPLSLAITLVWPFWSFRFVLPLTPFLFLYLIGGIRTLARGSWRLATLAMLCVIGLNLVDHAGYLVLRSKESPGVRQIQWLADADNVDHALAWIGTGVEEGGTLATTNPALVYLRTGRKGVALDDPTGIVNSLSSRGVRYGASFVPTPLPDDAEADYKVLYRPDSGLWIIDVE